MRGEQCARAKFFVIFFRRAIAAPHPSHRIATGIEADIFQPQRGELRCYPIRSGRLAERRSSNGRHLAVPLPQLRFLQMKPLESAMHPRLPSQLADGLKGRDGDRFRHVVFKCGIRGALQECMLSLSKFRSRNPSPILVNPFSTEPLSGTGRWPPPSDRQARDCDPPVSQLSPPLPDDPARPPQTFPPGCAPCDAEIHCRKLYR